MTATILILSLALSQSTQAPATADEGRRAAEVRGRITEKETGRPLARAIVDLFAETGEPVSTTTDDDGRYEIVGLRAGTYHLRARGGGHRATHVSQPFVGTDWRSGSIVLKPGEVRNGVDVALLRALAFTVRVTDEWGEPLWGLSIALRNAANGAEEHPMTSHRMTDDRGMVRLFAVPAGRYIVCAEDPFVAMAPSVDNAARERFVRTCYPSALDTAGAEPVSVESGEPVDIEIRMRRNRTFTISGTVLDASGLPSGAAHVSLIAQSRTGSSSIGFVVGSDGRFVARNVVPGSYAIEARVGGPERPQDGRDMEAAYMPVTVGSSDVEGLVLSMTKAVEVTGRITTDDGSGPLPKRADPGIMVLAQFAGSNTFDGGSLRMTMLQDDQTFVLSGMYGPRRLAIANTPPGWYVKSIQYRGRDVAGVPFEVTSAGGPGALEVVLSTRGATLTGRVTDDAGKPVKGGWVAVIPADPARRSLFDIESERILSTGAYRVGPMRRGEYLVAAIDSADFMDPQDGDLLSKLAESAERVTLGTDEERTIDLRIVRIR